MQPADSRDPFMSAEHWKKCAEEAQAIADGAEDAPAGQVLRHFIRQFERLARQAGKVSGLF